MIGRLLNGPDDAVRLYWELIAREESAGGRDPFLIKGMVPADACGSCGHDQHHEVPAKRGHGWVDRCRRCGFLWQSSIEYIMRGAIRISSRPHELERRLVELGDLERAIDQLPPADEFLYGLYLLTDRSYAYVAKLATSVARVRPDRWRSPPGGFTENRVRGAVGRARQTLRRSLAARGLMARTVPVLMQDGGQESVEAVEPLPLNVVIPADPASWAGVLQDLEISPESLVSRLRQSPLTRLSRGKTTALGTVYREVPL